jgi:hypothetical protein
MANEALDDALAVMREAQEELAESITAQRDPPLPFLDRVELIALNAAELSIATADVVQLLAETRAA